MNKIIKARNELIKKFRENKCDWIIFFDTEKHGKGVKTIQKKNK